MKQYRISARFLNQESFEFLENCCHNITIVDDGTFWLNDFATGARVITSIDTLELTISEEQETILKLKFGDKLAEVS